MIGVVSCKNKFYLIFECFRFYFWRKKEIWTNVPCSRSHSDGRTDACSYTVNTAVAAWTRCLCFLLLSFRYFAPPSSSNRMVDANIRSLMLRRVLE